MSRYLPQLDGLRALAIIPVLIVHLWTYPPGYNLLNSIAINGFIGVDLFFVLSGFLITGILYRAKNGQKYFRSFWGKRALRIFPLSFLLLFVVLVAMPSSEALRQIREDWFLYAFWLSNIAVAMDGWRLLASDITWSLSVEEQFYLVWPFIVKWLPARRLIPLCLGIIVLCPIARAIAFPLLGKYPLMVLTPFRVDAFAIGAVIALWMQDPRYSAALMKKCAATVLAMLGPVLLIAMMKRTYNEHEWISASLGYSLVDIASGALLILALESKRIARVLSNRVLVFIGKISFGIYVFHALCEIVGSKLFAELGLYTGHSIVDAVTSLVGFTALSILAATLSFHLYEMPFLRLKRYFDCDRVVAPPGSARAIG